MTTYYEFIHVEQNASSNEIEAAIDTQYDKWRQLISHHDPQIAAQANQAILLLEQIRDTLMNKKKREIYDSSIIDVDGLADPDAFLQTNFVPPFSTPKAKPDPKASTDRTDAWICTNPSCKKANRVGELFCAKCGTRIGLECSQCNKISELSNPFCSFCGVNKEEFYRSNQEKKINDLKIEINKVQQDINTLEHNLSKIIVTTKGYDGSVDSSKSGITVQIVISLLFIIPMCITVSQEKYWGMLFIPLGFYFAAFIGNAFFGRPSIKNKILDLVTHKNNLHALIKKIQEEKYYQ